MDSVRYLHPCIRAKGLKSVTSPHPMVKGATMASSDPQGLGHVLSDAEDEVSASSDPQGPGHVSSDAEDEVPASPNPRGSDSVSPSSQGEIFASPDPWGSDLLPDQSSGPRVGLESLQPLRHGSARSGARLGRVLMRLAVASGHVGKLASSIASTDQHCAANSLPDHRPTPVDRASVDWHCTASPPYGLCQGTL